jgi:hypothetical protein
MWRTKRDSWRSDANRVYVIESLQASRTKIRDVEGKTG